MATLYVKNFPNELYEAIKRLAGEEQRSISAEVIAILDEAVRQRERKHRRLTAMERIEQRRSRFHPSTDGKDTMVLLREDRER